MRPVLPPARGVMPSLRNAMAWLLQRRRPAWAQWALYAVLALVPALAVGSLLQLLLSAFGIDPTAFEREDLGTDLGSVLVVVGVAPLAETAVLSLVVAGLSVASRRKTFVAVASSVFWGALHARLGLLAFLPTGWAFFVFSCAYMAWRRDSYKAGFLAAAMAHLLYNAGVMAIAILLPGL